MNTSNTTPKLVLHRGLFTTLDRAKLSSVGDLRRDPTTDMDDARLEAALSLREIAGCHLKFAKEASNPTIWRARLRLAAKLEKEAAALDATAPQLMPGSTRNIARQSIRPAERGSPSPACGPRPA
jgi:hypothetical protein